MRILVQITFVTEVLALVVFLWRLAIHSRGWRKARPLSSALAILTMIGASWVAYFMTLDDDGFFHFFIVLPLSVVLLPAVVAAFAIHKSWTTNEQNHS